MIKKRGTVRRLCTKRTPIFFLKSSNLSIGGCMGPAIEVFGGCEELLGWSVEVLLPALEPFAQVSDHCALYSSSE